LCIGPQKAQPNEDEGEDQKAQPNEDEGEEQKAQPNEEEDAKGFFQSSSLYM
jgi:hypothetical protein